MKISEIITDKYKLRIPPTVYYELLADVREVEEDQEPTTKNDLGVDCISRAEAIKCLECDFDITGKENMKTVVNYINSAHDKIVNLPSVTPQLSVPEVTALTEWIEKLTKECEDAYNKGYTDGMKALEQEPKTGHWIKGYTFPDGAYWKCDKCNELIKVKIPMRYCNNCGAEMAETENI